MSKMLRLSTLALAVLAAPIAVAIADEANGSRIVVTGQRFQDPSFDTKSVTIYLGRLSFANLADRVPIAALLKTGAHVACTRSWDDYRNAAMTQERGRCAARAFDTAHASLGPATTIVAMNGLRSTR
jgi:hypothetical protein